MVGKTKSGKVLADGAGTPLGVHLEKTSPAEVKLVEAMPAQVGVKIGSRKRGKPQRLIGDREYGSNNKVATYQDGRKRRLRPLPLNSSGWKRNTLDLPRYSKSSAGRSDSEPPESWNGRALRSVISKNSSLNSKP
jgi:hypothetical protein